MLKLILFIFVFIPNLFFSQITNAAINIADSVSNTRNICPQTVIELKDSIFYPIEKTIYIDRKEHEFFFSYKIQFSKDLIANLNISINKDYSLNYISGFPDINYLFSPCNILTKHELWLIAKQNGLKTKFQKSKYSLLFEKDKIIIKFYERKSKTDLNYYIVNAITGSFLGHIKKDVSF